MMSIILHKNREETQFLEAVHLASMFKIKLNKITIFFFLRRKKCLVFSETSENIFRQAQLVFWTQQRKEQGDLMGLQSSELLGNNSTRRGKEREWQWLEVALQLPPYTRADTQMQSVAGLNAVGEEGLW